MNIRFIKDIQYIKYRFFKKWFTIWHKYQLHIQLKNIYKLLLLVVIAWIIGSMLISLSQTIFRNSDNNQNSISENKSFSYKKWIYFWDVIIVLTSGFDLENVSRFNFFSRIILVVMLIIGMIVVGLFTGSIVSMVIHINQRKDYLPEKPNNFQFNNPIIICGISSKIENIIREIQLEKTSGYREILIIDANADKFKIQDKNIFRDVWYLKENPTNREAFIKAIGRSKICSVIILSNSEGDKYHDLHSIETALAIESFENYQNIERKTNKSKNILTNKLHTIIEIMDERNKEYLKQTKINEWINVSQYSIKFISQTALRPCLGKVYSNLLESPPNLDDKTRIYFEELPDFFIDYSFIRIKRYIQNLKDLDITLIGFSKYINDDDKLKFNLTLRNDSYYILINPKNLKHIRLGKFKMSKILGLHNDAPLNRNDKLIYISNKIINLNKIKWRKND